MKVLLGVGMFLAVVFGPPCVVIFLCARAPEPEPPDPVRPLSLVLTSAALLILLLPVWVAILAALGVDVWALWETWNDLLMILYLALPFAIWGAWASNGSSRATAQPVLSRIQGTAFVLMLPSWIGFLFAVFAYDPIAHT